MGRRGPSHMGPYGLACSSCFKAKCKCVARADGGEGCQRCHRLNKPCRPSDALRRSAIDKKPSSAARIADLESKVALLISQLQAGGVGGGGSGDAVRTTQESQLEPGGTASASHPSVQPPDAAKGAGPGGRSSYHPEDANDDHHDDGHAASGSVRCSSSPAPTATPRLPDPPQPVVPDAEHEAMLETFRSRMLPHFAFVHLPAELTAHQLERDRPFLFRAVMCVASPSARDKAARGRALKRAIGEAMLDCEEQSSSDRMDLLLALLTYVSWGWHHEINHHSSLPRLMSQANSLACEIRLLDGSGVPDARITALFTPGSGCRADHAGALTRHEFLERQRAVLGCFVLSSVVSAHYHGQVDALRWTPEMDSGLAAVSTNHECPTDAALAAQVRLQLLAQKAVQVHQQQQLEHGAAAPTEMTTLPALLALAALQTQLRDLQTSLPATLPNRDLIAAHTHATALTLSETTHAIASLVPAMISHFTRMTSSTNTNPNPTAAALPTTIPIPIIPPSAMGAAAPNPSPTPSPAAATTATVTVPGPTPRQERLRTLGHTLRAVKACAAALLAPPPAAFAGIAFLQWAQLARCAAALGGMAAAWRRRRGEGGGGGGGGAALEYGAPGWGWEHPAAAAAAAAAVAAEAAAAVARGAVVDLPGLLGAVAGKLELVARLQREGSGEGEGGGGGSDDGDDGVGAVFARLARRMREFCAEAGRSAAAPPGGGAGTETGAGGAAVEGGAAVDGASAGVTSWSGQSIMQPTGGLQW
ncbi:785d6469-ec55-451a-855e-910be62cb85b [Thermothielavioides terrestris]|uniref:785d6469-ec55-451a-855e-910be62cb85b n=1 Tax=Thermothielavioides terrestris TaxID=2587410 RepID=A0A446BUK5_9PEZI|nr:785d6469-ec55-451a-855e-910be62cb85b [Thermothielavioides terrestris]